MYSTVLQKIHASRNIFITSHKNCPDATGSVCALVDFLRAQGKTVYPYLEEPVLKHLRYLPGSDEIQTLVPALSAFDLFFIVDADDFKQTGIPEELAKIRYSDASRYCVVNIDHHKTNENFGHVNIVDTAASSTCELLYGLLTNTDLPLTPLAAECLLTGIVGDTGNFTNAATTEKSLRIAADLVFHGANIFQIIQHIISVEASINTLRLWGSIFERLSYNKKYNVAASCVLQKDIRSCNASEESVEIVANFFNYIRGIKAGILIKETKEGKYKVSLRSTYPGIDVSKLAKMCGGGGHKKAAGFTVNSFLGCSL